MNKYFATLYKNSAEEDGPLYDPTPERRATYATCCDLIKESSDKTDVALIDVGGGWGYSKTCIPNEWRYTNMTRRKEERRVGLAQGINCIDGNILDIPFAADTFDVVLCVLTLQYVTNQVLGLRELARICRQNGFVVVVYSYETDDYLGKEYFNILSEGGLRNVMERMGCRLAKTVTVPDHQPNMKAHLFRKTGPTVIEFG